MASRMLDGTVDELALGMMRTARRVSEANRDAPAQQRNARLQIALREWVRHIENRVIRNAQANARLKETARG
jgi:hypothetical protein